MTVRNINADGGRVVSVLDGTVDNDAATVKQVKAAGKPGVATLAFTLDNLQNADTFTMGGQTYTIAKASGALSVNMTGNAHAGNGGDPYLAADVIAALVTALNANASREFDGLATGSATVALVQKSITGSNPAVAASRASVLCSFTAAVNAAAAALVKQMTGKITITANHVTMLAAGGGAGEITLAGFETQPSFEMLACQTSGGRFKDLATIGRRWAQVHSNFWVLLAIDPGAVLDAGDIISYLVEA